MKKLLLLTIACLLLAITPSVLAHNDDNDEENDNPSPTPQVVVTTDVNTNQSGGINNTNTNVNTNTNSQSQKQENRQEVTITNNAQPVVLAAIARPRALPATGPSPVLYALALTALPLGLFLRRYKTKR